MKIDVMLLQQYIKKVSVNNTILMLNLNFTENGVETTVRDTENITMTSGILKKEAFEEYEVIGEIFIKNSKFLNDMLNTFSGLISLDKLGDNFLSIKSPSRKAGVILAEEKICENVVRSGEPTIPTTVSINVQKNNANIVVKDMSLLNVNKVKLVVKDKKLTFQVGKVNDYDFVTTTTDCTSEEDVSVSVGAVLANIIGPISDEFTLKIGNDMPAIFHEETSLVKVTTYLANIVDEY